jgi:drug/metabolite transporter (DMT)-like permease
MNWTWWIAVPCAIAGAACFGAAGVLQHQATQKAPEEKPLRPGLLVALMQMSGFRIGVLLGILGFVAQVVALRFAPLILVQPLLITDVLFYLAFASMRNHHPPDRRMQGGALLALAGLAGFLVAAGPSSGQEVFDSAAALPLGIGLIVLVSICLAVASRLRDEIRALPLALATAICYGVTAGLVRSLVAPTVTGPIWSHWELYAVIIVGPAGFLLNQNAYQSGMLGSVALTTITIGDPLVAIGIGVAWLGESIAGGWAILGEVVAVGVMGLGIFLLATRAQQIADEVKAGRRHLET